MVNWSICLLTPYLTCLDALTAAARAAGRRAGSGQRSRRAEPALDARRVLWTLPRMVGRGGCRVLWTLVVWRVGESHDPIAPWECVNNPHPPEKCPTWEEPTPELETRPAVSLENMAPRAHGENMTCCDDASGPPPDCSGPPPELSCLSASVPFGMPPACVRRLFHCCLKHWAVDRFGLGAWYDARGTVACGGTKFDVEGLSALDVVFDHRSLLKLGAAFRPEIAVLYKEDRAEHDRQARAATAAYAGGGN